MAAHNVKQKPPAMVRRGIVRVDPYRPPVRFERLVVAAQRGERAPLADEHSCIRAACISPVAQVHRLFIALVRPPRAAPVRLRLARLYDAHPNDEQQVVPEHLANEILGYAVGNAPVNAGVLHFVDDAVAPGHDAAEDAGRLLVEHAAEPALVQDRAGIFDRGDVPARRHGLWPCHGLEALKRVAPHDRLHRVVFGMGLHVVRQEALAYLLDRGCKADDKQVEVVGVVRVHVGAKAVELFDYVVDASRGQRRRRVDEDSLPAHVRRNSAPYMRPAPAATRACPALRRALGRARRLAPHAERAASAAANAGGGMRPARPAAGRGPPGSRPLPLRSPPLPPQPIYARARAGRP